MDYVKVVFEALLIWIVVFVVFTLFAERLKKPKAPKRHWPTDEMYKNFYRTGDRRFLYDEHYKKKGYNDHRY